MRTLKHLKVTRREKFGRRLKRWRLRLSIVTILISVVGYDYISYHAKLNSTLREVVVLNGHYSSLTDWPFGKELHISFDRPLTSDELQKLAVLNSLSSRHFVVVYFYCDLESGQLDEVRSALTQCGVNQSEQ